jgi:hypothetical protein
MNITSPRKGGLSVCGTNVLTNIANNIPSELFAATITPRCII